MSNLSCWRLLSLLHPPPLLSPYASQNCYQICHVGQRNVSAICVTKFMSNLSCWPEAPSSLLCPLPSLLLPHSSSFSSLLFLLLRAPLTLHAYAPPCCFSFSLVLIAFLAFASVPCVDNEAYKWKWTIKNSRQYFLWFKSNSIPCPTSSIVF